MIEWINRVFGISNEVSIPTLISIIVFLSGGTISFLFNQFNAFSSRRVTRKTFCLLIDYVLTDIKIKEKNVQELKNQIHLKHEDGFRYTQKSITYLDAIFELGFKEIFYSFRKKFFWNICNRSLKYKSFHKSWDSLRELKYFETKIHDHIDEFDKNFNERVLTYISSQQNFIKNYSSHQKNFDGKKAAENNPAVHKYIQREMRIWVDWHNFEGNKHHYHNSFTHFIQPLIALNKEFLSLNICENYIQELISCENAYEEIKDAIETNNMIFTTYSKFYRNKSRLLKKCLKILKA